MSSSKYSKTSDDPLSFDDFQKFGENDNPAWNQVTERNRRTHTLQSKRTSYDALIDLASRAVAACERNMETTRRETGEKKWREH